MDSIALHSAEKRWKPLIIKDGLDPTTRKCFTTRLCGRVHEFFGKLKNQDNSQEIINLY
jgi:hypothetical protein